MIKTSDKFILEYDEGINYIDDLVSILEQKGTGIMDFFELREIKNKKKIKIWGNVSDYKRYLENYVSKYYDWMIADTYDGNINMLAIEECRKTKSHSDITMEEFSRNIVHEFVHFCQQQINPDSENVEWFWEALATNLGNPFDHVTSIQYDKSALMYNFDSLSFNYEIAYTIGRYLLKNYSHKQILEYVKSPLKLKSDTDNIINEAKKWFNERYLELPVVPKAENDDFVIYGSDSLVRLSNDVLLELSENKKRILAFFGLTSYRKVEINLYDNHNDFLKLLKNIRPKNSLIPEYCRGTFDDFMINQSINLERLEENYANCVHIPLHEFVHIIYNDVMTDKRILWLDEGLAMNLSLDHSMYEDEEKFSDFINKVMLKTKRIPSMNELVHGKKFVNEDYNGYDLSYLAVRYMFETMTHDDILAVVKDNDKALRLGENVLNEAFNYYQDKLELVNNKVTGKSRKWR